MSKLVTLAALAAALTVVSVADATRVMARKPATAEAVAPVKHVADPLSARASLSSYLAVMSRPVRLSLLRAQAVTNAIDGFLDHGDPPFLGQITRGCQRLRGGGARGPFLRIIAPARLQVSHRRLFRAYLAARRSCERAMTTARALLRAIDRFAETGGEEDKAALQRADTFARRTLPFERNVLRSFIKAVRTWRSGALRYAALVGLPAPEWLKDLKVGP
jgi:uncharacterized iron-regulated protein